MTDAVETQDEVFAFLGDPTPWLAALPRYVEANDGECFRRVRADARARENGP